MYSVVITARIESYYSLTPGGAYMSDVVITAKIEGSYSTPHIVLL